MIKVTPNLEDALASMARVHDLIDKELVDNIEDTTTVVNLLETRMYIQMIQEWMQCSDEIEAKNAGEVFEEIHDGWRWYGD